MCIMKTVVKATVFLIMFYLYIFEYFSIAVLEYSVRHKQQHVQLSDSVIIPIYLLTIE